MGVAGRTYRFADDDGFRGSPGETQMIDPTEYRRSLAARLRASGDLRSAGWVRAVERVPREIFIGPRFLRLLEWPRWEEVTANSMTAAEWLDLIYKDRTLVTQVGDSDDVLDGNPTSSSTMPGLVVRMLEDLDLHDGQRVLEIGTGTGYSTALLSERLGPQHVVSVEVDGGLAIRARQRLAAAGYRPTVIAADGLDGWRQGGPYDRLIATCAVRFVPSAWLEQVRTGGRILTSVFGSLQAYGLVNLEATGPGTASGRFLPGTVSFMHARAHTPEPWTQLPYEEGERRSATFGFPAADDWTGRFIVQSALPDMRFTSFYRNDRPDRLTHIFRDSDGAAAWLHETDHGWRVTERGPARLWARAEDALAAWNAAGRPPQERYGLTVTPEGQHVWLESPERKLEQRT
jgi:methyltransferase of ATP-grasp peptide maturase system